MASTWDQLQSQLAAVREQYGQRVAEYPQYYENLRQQTYGQDQILPKLRQTKDDAIMQLWDVDKRLADRYANPESEMFIRDPYQREKIAAGQHQSTLGLVSGATRLEEQRTSVLEDALERGVKIYELGLNALEREHSMLNTELDNLLRKMSLDAQLANQKATQPKMSTADILSLLTKLPQEPTEPKPDLPDYMIQDMLNRPEVNWKSPGGQWVFNPETAEFEPFRFPEEKGLEALRGLLEPFNLNPAAVAYLSQYPEEDEKVARNIMESILFPETAEGGYSEKVKEAARNQVWQDLLNYTQPVQPNDPDNVKTIKQMSLIQVVFLLKQQNPELTFDEILELAKQAGLEPIPTQR
jgi:hypothetical protein